MTKLYKLFVVSLAVMGLLCPHDSVGQISNVHTVTGQPIMITKAYDGVEGSPYFTPEWRTGVVLYDQQRMENVQLKYDAFEDQIEILYNNAPFLPEKKFVQGFEFAHMSESGELFNYQFRNGFEGDGINKENYLSIIYEGDDVVLAEWIRMDQISVTPATYGQKEYKEFTLVRSHVLIKAGKAQRFKPSKKNFANEFPKIESDLKGYFKEYKVDFANYVDLAKLMAFIDQTIGDE